eukprot:m.11029 g.11029  ORF g.11029 m.11029 type:complete len:535 (-) comp6802_c0_seq2:11-1615(-)
MIGVLCLFVFAVGVVIRVGVSFGPYSGYNKPPMFGDFEAQRHWMEITTSLPVREWYVNGTNNDLEYWGLDYPPLTAYHSWLCGKVANWINPSWMALGSSRGFESEELKMYMRNTSLLADVVVFFSAIYMWASFMFSSKRTQTNTTQHHQLKQNNNNYKTGKKKSIKATNKRSKKSSDNRSLPLGQRTEDLLEIVGGVAGLAFHPCFILIDHGHFQYNSISLGFALWATYFIATKRFVLASVLFVLSLSYKQMSLFYAPVFFIFLLSSTLFSPKTNMIGRLFALGRVGVTVIVTFAACFFPFLTDLNLLFQVLHRMFPFARGLFEDYVSNFWCLMDVVFKLRSSFDQPALAQMSLVATLVAMSVSCFQLFRKPTNDNFVFTLITCSLSFFFFSFQVHEKTILLVALPVALVRAKEHSFIQALFMSASTFSLYPLLEKDGQVVQYAVVIIFAIASWIVLYASKWKRWQIVLFTLHLMTLAGIHYLFAFVEPPASLPYLWVLVNAAYSFMAFVVTYLYFHFQLFSSKPSKLLLKKMD